MKVIQGQRNTGRTTKLLIMMIEEPDLKMVLANNAYVRRMEAKYPAFEGRFISAMDDSVYRGQRYVVVIDDWDLITQFSPLFDDSCAIRAVVIRGEGQL